MGQEQLTKENENVDQLSKKSRRLFKLRKLVIVVLLSL